MPGRAPATPASQEPAVEVTRPAIELGRRLAEVPDVAVDVLGVPVLRAFLHDAADADRVLDHGRRDAVDDTRPVGDHVGVGGRLAIGHPAVVERRPGIRGNHGLSTTETKPAGSIGMSRRESESADAAGNGDAAGDGDASMLVMAWATRARRRRGRRGRDDGDRARRGAVVAAAPAITTRPTMDRLVRVRFMALAPTVVRRLSSTRIEANRRGEGSPPGPAARRYSIDGQRRGPSHR